MSFISRIFSRRKKIKPHDFTEVMKHREQLVVFLPSNLHTSFRLISIIATMKSDFKEFFLFTSEYALPLFSKLKFAANMSYLSFSSEQPVFDKAVIFNFCRQKAVSAFVKRCTQSTIIDMENQANLQFLPLPDDPVIMVQRFCEFYDLKFAEQKLSLPLSQQEIAITKQRFLQNRFPDFLLEIDEQFSSRTLEGIIKSFKQNYSANIYFSDSVINTKDLINIEAIQKKELFDLYLLAASCDVFVTSKEEVARLFGDLEIDCILLGKQLEYRNVHSFVHNDLFKMKGYIQEKLKNIKEKN